MINAYSINTPASAAYYNSLMFNNIAAAANTCTRYHFSDTLAHTNAYFYGIYMRIAERKTNDGRVEFRVSVYYCKGGFYLSLYDASRWDNSAGTALARMALTISKDKKDNTLRGYLLRRLNAWAFGRLS